MLNHAVAAGKDHRNPLSVEWQVNHWWLLGVRSFEVVSYRTGQVRRTFETDDGQLQFRMEDVLVKRQRELGRLMRMDFFPQASRKGTGLDRVRKAAAAQIYYENLVDPLQLEQLKMMFNGGLLDYGGMGVGVWVERSPGSPTLKPTLEMIPLWELLPIPGSITTRTQQRGIVRDRWVTYGWLKNKQGLKLPKDSKDPRLKLRKVLPGDRIVSEDDATGLYNSSMFSGASTRVSAYNDDVQGAGQAPEGEDYGQLQECWIPDADGRVCEYVCKVGDVICDHQPFYEEYELKRPWMPIDVGRYYDTGGFYPRSFLGPLIPVNRELEKMFSQLFKNVQEIDDFGYLLIPAGMGVRREDLQKKGRPRAIFFEPDYTIPNLRPDTIQPFNSGEAPGRIAASALSLMDRLSRESELYSGGAPGRVDSASGLGLVYETSSIPLVPVSASIGNCWATIWRAVLGQGRGLLKSEDRLMFSLQDDTVVGIVMDAQSGEISLSDNPLPDPSEVLVDIRERMPQMKEKIKQEVLALASGPTPLLDPITLAWINFRDNLGLKLGFEAEVNSIRSCMMRNVVQFGDGQKPQNVNVSTHDLHPIHLKIITAFMARPEFSLASVEVRSAFEQRKAFHEQALGGFPMGLPRPEDMGLVPADNPMPPMGSAPQGPVPNQLGDALQQAGQMPNQETPLG